MKKLLFVLLGIVLINFAVGCNTQAAEKGDGIKFYKGSWKEVAQKADKENKLIFVDIYATWCGPCKLLKKKTFPDKEVGAYFNSKFINTTFDGEKGDGITLAERYKIKGYPTLLILDSKGNVVAQTAGYMSPEALIRFGKSVEGKQ